MSLLRANPSEWAVHASWQPLVSAFWRSQTGQKLTAFLDERIRHGARIFPPQPLRALERTPLNKVRVVLLGQDPYHGQGQAEGLSFSVPQHMSPPPSLRNIFKELQADTGLQPPMSGSLMPWAERGVLLLNTCLTVEEGLPASHAKQGWEELTDAIIRAVAQQAQPVVFLLWGAHAQTKAGLIDKAEENAEKTGLATKKHLVLKANHPSPLSAARPPVPFLGCGHFGQVNRWLKAAKQNPIDW